MVATSASRGPTTLPPPVIEDPEIIRRREISERRFTKFRV